jgi:hypothetical protein
MRPKIAGRSDEHYDLFQRHAPPERPLESVVL